MKEKVSLLLMFTLLFCQKSEAKSPIPSPLSQSFLHGSYVLGNDNPIFFPKGDEKAEFSATYLQNLLFKTSRLALQVEPSDSDRLKENSIQIFRCSTPFSTSREAYKIIVNKKGIQLCAAKDAGLFYAVTTLAQIVESDHRIAFTKIEDAPRFSWRGMLLDSARHYQSPEFIKKLLDTLAFFKINVLHWHLTDDQAWRLEIKQYPRLTDFAAWRVPAGLGPAQDIDPATGKARLYGGFYTQEQVRELVQYAGARNITIVPEIEMPGHSTAAIVAYPSLASVQDPPTTISSDWGVFPFLYNVSDDSFQFLENILDEVIALFPGDFVHVGGDEAIKDQWQSSPLAQATIKKLGLKNEDELQAWFIQRIGKYLESKGKRIIGWDDILAPNLSQGSAVMSWHGLDGALKGARSGHDVVVTALPTYYFDGRMNDSAEQPPGNADNIVSLKDVYSFNPMPSALTGEQEKHILGIEGAVWTENFRTEDQLSRTTFPREIAIAEVAWSTPQNSDWNSFLSRVPAAQEQISSFGLNYSDSPFEVIVSINQKKNRDTIPVSLSNQTNFGEIRYTLDGSLPTAESSLFDSEISIPLGSTLQAATFFQGSPISRIKTKNFDPASLNSRNSFELSACFPDSFNLASEDDAPIAGDWAFFIVNYMHPCWIFENADLSNSVKLRAQVGQLPFNLQIGSDINNIHYRKPSTPSGELEVRLDNCYGVRLLSIPLESAVNNPRVTTLPDAEIPALFGYHNLCFTFTQWNLDPYWVIDRVSLLPDSR